MRLYTMTVLVLALALSGVVIADPPAITLEQAVKKALDDNYHLKSTRYDLSARKWGLLNAVKSR
jgi:hypothetical protein